jgi:hypothetical protein
MKIRQILEAKYYGDAGDVELTQAPDDATIADKKQFERVISKAWSDGVVYKGENVFELVYNSGLSSHLEKELEDSNKSDFDLTYYDSQESYLGYLPSEDAFVMGFDTWAEVKNPYFDEYDEEGEYENEPETEHEVVPNVVMFTAEGGGVKDYNILSQFVGMMYTGTKSYDQLHKTYPDLVDIRLD